MTLLDKKLNDIYESLIPNKYAQQVVIGLLLDLLDYLELESENRKVDYETVWHFFLVQDNWGFDLAHIEYPLREIIEDFGGCLHDTIEHPEIAENFDSTPARLRIRLHALTEGSGDRI